MNKTVISERAVVARINRKLKPEGERLRLSRARGWKQPEYWVQEVSRNLCLEHDVNLYAIGRDLGVLAENEAIEGWDDDAA